MYNNIYYISTSLCNLAFFLFAIGRHIHNTIIMIMTVILYISSFLLITFILFKRHKKLKRHESVTLTIYLFLDITFLICYSLGKL